MERLLREDAPADWAEIHLDFRGSSSICQADMSGTTANGGALLMPLPDGVVALMRTLRARMYEPGQGTWLSVHVTLRRGRAADFRFNFTDDPQWSPPVAPTVFSMDVEEFPRDPQHLPEWLRQRLVEAAEFEEGYRNDRGSRE
ncbi:hypothetical protein [Saccharopolyspora taberi]|uniref:hypothetical protein n=1 Tax=Saccharopolyspora taberi TaxID=60895 RepID=UPI0031D4A657